jgi:hypothetical protein
MRTFQGVCLTSHNTNCVFLRRSGQRHNKKKYNMESVRTEETEVSGLQFNGIVLNRRNTDAGTWS